MKHIYIEFKKNDNKEDAKFKVVDHVRILKYKNIFSNDYALNWSVEGFVIKKVKNPMTWAYVILKVNKLLERFTKKNRKTQIKSLELKNKSRDAVINYMLNGKATIILLAIRLIKKM